MDNFYRENILDHYKNPRNFGKLNKADSSYTEKNVSCGDMICMQIKCREGNRKSKIIEKIMFYGDGCAISIAAASMLTEKASGQEIEKIKKIKSKDIISMLGITLTPTRLKCALLPLEVLHKTLAHSTKLRPRLLRLEELEEANPE